MRVRVLLFAGLAEAAGERSIDIELPASARAGDALAECRRLFPALGPSLTSVALAVNDAYADPRHPLHEADVVALIPPVSGG